MAKICFEESEIEVRPGESLLESLLQAGHAIPNSCRAGACQSCLMQVQEGDIPAAAQLGLKDTYQAQGYILACRCLPESDLRVSLPQSSLLRVSARVSACELLAADVLRVRLETDSPFAYRAGQYVTVWRDETLGRSYSLASVPGLDDTLELHIRHVPGGLMSGWMHESLKPGDSLELQGPAGHCFYLPEPEKNLLLAGTGTGLAPLIGIARDALNQGHRGEIHLYHGALGVDGLYLREVLTEMAERHANFYYHAYVMAADQALPEPVQVGAVDAAAMAVADSLAAWKVYLCGAPDLVNKMRKKAFLAGASMSDIYADAFLTAADASSAA